MKNTTAPANLPSSANLPAREELIASSLPLVRSIALRLRKAYGFPSPLEDLIAVGVTGLVEAADRFDSSRSVAFTTFAFLRIRGAIFDLHRHDPGNAIHYQLPRKVITRPTGLQTDQSSEQVLRLVPPPDTSTEIDGTSTRTAPEPSLREIGPIAFVPFDKLDAMTDESALDADDEIDRKRSAERVRVALATLPPRERRILEMHYYTDNTFAEIGAEIGISGPRAFRIHQRGLQMLRRALVVGEPANDNADGSLVEVQDEENEHLAPVMSRRRTATGGK